MKKVLGLMALLIVAVYASTTLNQNGTLSSLGGLLNLDEINLTKANEIISEPLGFQSDITADDINAKFKALEVKLGAIPSGGGVSGSITGCTSLPSGTDIAGNSTNGDYTLSACYLNAEAFDPPCFVSFDETECRDFCETGGGNKKCFDPNIPEISWQTVTGEWDTNPDNTRLTSGSGYATIASRDRFLSGAGTISFTLEHNDGEAIAGFGNYPLASYPTKYGIYLAQGNLRIMLNGSYPGGVIETGVLGTHDYRIEIESSEIRYYKDNVLIYTANQAPTYPLVIGLTSTLTTTNIYSNVQFSGEDVFSPVIPSNNPISQDLSAIVWDTFSGNTINGPTAAVDVGIASWGDSAFMVQKISVAKNGFIEFQFDSGTGDVMAGLFTERLPAASAYNHSSATCLIYKNTQFQPFAGGGFNSSSYSPGDRVRYVLDKGVIRVFKNGVETGVCDGIDLLDDSGPDFLYFGASYYSNGNSVTILDYSFED